MTAVHTKYLEAELIFLFRMSSQVEQNLASIYDLLD